MRKVELLPGLSSSVLGFGCAPILGAVDGVTARRALDAALDVGITHLDIAPSYGYGEAETWLGQALLGRRDEVVIATKFGIVATTTARLLKPAKPLVRFLRRLRGKAHAKAVLSSAFTQAAPRKTSADRLHARLPMTAKGLRFSVETSLRRLRTDRIDWLLLHEPLLPIAEIAELKAEATDLKKEGKLRGWGLAYMRSEEEIHASSLHFFDALQFDLSPSAAGYANLLERRRDSSNIFFSPFRGVSTDISRVDVLRQLARDFPRSVILCSMFNPEHIRANALAVV